MSFFKANRLSEPLTGFFPASGASGSEEDEARNRRGWRKPPSLLSGSLDAGYGQETERRLCPMTSGPLYLRGGCFDRLEKTLRSTNILAPTLKITGDRTVSLGGPITSWMERRRCARTPRPWGAPTNYTLLAVRAASAWAARARHPWTGTATPKPSRPPSARQSPGGE